MKSVALNGKEWRYRVEGSGSRTLLMLPGALGSGEFMAHYVSELLPGVNVIVPDYSTGMTVQEFLNAFEVMIQAEGADAPVVYGGSFGGLLAQCWARRHPDRTPGLILSGAAFPDPLRLPANRRMLRLLPLIPMPLVRSLMKIAARSIAKNIPKHTESWRTELLFLAGKIQREDLASRYSTAIDFDSHYSFSPADLQNSPIKILLLEGSKDRIAGKKVREGMRTLYPQATIKTFEGAGHSSLLTHPDEWKSAVSNQLLNVI
jgi:pimeloyl-ACP methyl ester carboxylesterase